MKTAEEWIHDLQLEAHPEGGYFRQTDRSPDNYTRKGKELPLYTTIYFLLTPDSPSHFHQLSSDEIWFYHAGEPLTVHSLHEDESYSAVSLGLQPNQHLHYTVKAGTIFGSSVEKGYSIVSCAVVPGFDFSDFKLFTQTELLTHYPKHSTIIKKLAYETLPE